MENTIFVHQKSFFLIILVITSVFISVCIFVPLAQEATANHRDRFYYKIVQPYDVGLYFRRHPIGANHTA